MNNTPSSSVITYRCAELNIYNRYNIWDRDKNGGWGLSVTGFLCVQKERGGLPLYPCGWGLCGHNIHGLNRYNI